MDTRRIERYAADVYRRLQNANPREDTHAMIAQKYVLPDNGPWMQSGIGPIHIDFEDLQERIQTTFFETLQNPETRTSIIEASEALRRARFRNSTGMTCSRGIVKIQSFLYEFHTVTLDYGWTLRFECVCLGGRISKTIYEKPTIHKIAVQIPNVFEAQLCGTVASLIFVRPTLVDIRPIIREIHRVAVTYGCIDFRSSIPLDWVLELWLPRSTKQKNV